MCMVHRKGQLDFLLKENGLCQAHLCLISGQALINAHLKGPARGGRKANYKRFVRLLCHAYHPTQFSGLLLIPERRMRQKVIRGHRLTEHHTNRHIPLVHGHQFAVDKLQWGSLDFKTVLPLEHTPRILLQFCGRTQHKDSPTRQWFVQQVFQRIRCGPGPCAGPGRFKRTQRPELYLPHGLLPDNIAVKDHLQAIGLGPVRHHAHGVHIHHGSRTTHHTQINGTQARHIDQQE